MYESMQSFKLSRPYCVRNDPYFLGCHLKEISCPIYQLQSCFYDNLLLVVSYIVCILDMLRNYKDAVLRLFPTNT